MKHALTSVIICAKYEKNQSRTADITECKWQNVQYFSSSLCKFMAKWPWGYGRSSKVIIGYTSSHARNHLWNAFRTTWADMRWWAISQKFYTKVMIEWPWRYGPKSRVITCHTLVHECSLSFVPIETESMQKHESHRTDNSLAVFITRSWLNDPEDIDWHWESLNVSHYLKQCWLGLKCKLVGW